MKTRINIFIVIIIALILTIAFPTGNANAMSMDTDLSNSDASFWGEDADDWAGFSVSDAGDVNGDGYDDILIGAWCDEDGGSSDAGQVYLIFGKSTGWTMDTHLSNASASFWGEDANDAAGFSVSGTGDVNGDGYDDFLIGANWNSEGGDGAGQVYLIFGKSMGWTMDTHLSNADASFLGENAGDGAGRSVSGAGDVNSDGFDDILIGVCHNDDGGAGQVYLIFGKSMGWTMDTHLSNADASFFGEDWGDQAGSSISSAGDVNGDGYDDILIGASDDEDSGSDMAGQVYLIFGKRIGWAMDTNLSNADASFWGEDEFDFAGWSVSGAGDVNNDGFDDILIGAWGDEDGGGDNTGQVYLIFGECKGWTMDTHLSNADASFWGEDAFDTAGISVSGAGDINSDGFDDILIGASGDEDGSGDNAGQVYMIFGKSTDWIMDTDLSNADASFRGEDADDQAGFSVSCAGDVNGDGFSDILIGAYNDDDGSSAAGQVYLILGKNDSQTETGPVINHPDDQTIEQGAIGTITWTVTESEPDKYWILRNSEMYVSPDSYDSGIDINIEINTSEPGIWNYTIIANDTAGNNATDQVNITVGDDTFPVISHPEDQTIEQGANGTINWTVTETEPDKYWVLRDGEMYVSPDSYDSGVDINIEINTSEPGIWNYTIVANDIAGNTATDQVDITIANDTSPVISHPEDQTIEQGANGTIAWIVTESEPDKYWVLKDGEMYVSPDSYDSDVDINIEINTSEPGVWNYTIVANDTAGNIATDQVNITVADDTCPVISHPEDQTIEQGATGTITWTVTESNPDKYWVLRNGEMYVSPDSYDSGVDINIDIDTSEPGVWNYTIIANDTIGNIATDQVNITVADDTSFFFSTEMDFIIHGSEPLDGNPIISDGDLLYTKDCSIFARNRELLLAFEMEIDLGLDAADVIDAEKPLIAFSTEIDDPEDRFTAGDLLATNGIIIPSFALMAAFDDMSYVTDLGLDAVHFIGDKENIINFFKYIEENGMYLWEKDPGGLSVILEEYDIDIWFSTEGTAPIPNKPLFLDGDLLSARYGTIIAQNNVLLPAHIPAGIPDRGVDFGLDALTAQRSGSREKILFSTEILYNINNLYFTDGDILMINNGLDLTNKDLIHCFEPKANFLGLDALSIEFYEDEEEDEEEEEKKPDLIIQDFEQSIINGLCKIEYHISNIGTASAEGSTAYLYIDGDLIAENFTDSLAPGESVWGEFTHQYTGIHIYKVCADGPDDIDEINEANNCLEKELIYDPDIPADDIIYHDSFSTGIWRMDPNGSGNTQLSNYGGFAEYSYDRLKIAFSEYFGIWVMDADGTNQKHLREPGKAPTWSPDGKRIAFHVDVSPHIMVMNADGTNANQISDNPGSFPQWSPDGSKIAYHGEVNNGIWLINPDGINETLLYSSGGYPDWSPDGSKIVYTSLTDWCIWIMNADGTGQTKLTEHKGIHPTWSSDGTRVAYEDLDNNQGIRVINIDGSDDHLINKEGHAPDWS